MRADRRYTDGLMARLDRTITPAPGHAWHLECGSVTYGRWWRMFERDNTTGELHREIAGGRNERDVQVALGSFLDGYDRHESDTHAATIRQQSCPRAMPPVVARCPACALFEDCPSARIPVASTAAEYANTRAVVEYTADTIDHALYAAAPAMLAALRVMVEHASEMHPHFASPRGQRDLCAARDAIDYANGRP